VSAERQSVDKATSATPDSGDVASRAEGRPPEERSSEDPAGQAEAILQESEERVSERAGSAEPTGSS
jgi:hypothetical protein